MFIFNFLWWLLFAVSLFFNFIALAILVGTARDAAIVHRFMGGGGMCNLSARVYYRKKGIDYDGKIYVVNENHEVQTFQKAASASASASADANAGACDEERAKSE